MIPGFNANTLKNVEVDEKKMSHIEAIIKSMTKKERNDPSIINGSRRKRIAAGSGTTVQEVNRLLKDFEEMKKMMKMMTDMGKRGKKGFKKLRLPF
jgi:signal recognition particle subunit SRP54